MAGSRSHPDWFHNFPQPSYPVVAVNHPGQEHNEVAGHEVARHEVDGGHEVAGHEVAGREGRFETVCQQAAEIARGQDVVDADSREADPDLAIEVFDDAFDDESAHLCPVVHQGEVEEAHHQAVRHRNCAAAHRDKADCSDESSDLRRLLQERPTRKQYTHTCVCSEQQASSEARQVDLHFLMNRKESNTTFVLIRVSLRDSLVKHGSLSLTARSFVLCALGFCQYQFCTQGNLRKNLGMLGIEPRLGSL